MPTPVSAARQCLAVEAASALDEAVTVARRRAHAQTTSLHVVSALLSLPSSSSSLLRDALARAGSAAYSPRLQFKALELCFSVALDRLPSASASSSSSSSSNQQQKGASTPAEPPVSNSLMAAIKRSQANQRRNPETFHLYQQQQQPQSSAFAGVKVELHQLIISILDDPVVSRVFGEAGFRSCDIKFAVLRPPPSSILRFPRVARRPPLFLCNFSSSGDMGDEFDPVGPRGFGFPFSKQLVYSDGSDENCRRIGELLASEKGRNPLLVGAGAADALRDFVVIVVRQNWGALLPWLSGMRLFSIEKEFGEFAAGGQDRAWVELKFEELRRVLAEDEECRAGPGVLLCLGDLKVFVDEGGSSGQEGSASGDREAVALRHVVSELTKVLRAHSGRLWFMGSSATYETYMKFLACYPSVDKDWDLQLLPITTVKAGSSGLFSRPNSLMRSLVPLGGFFPVASHSVVPSTRPQPAVRCLHCNEKYEQEVAALMKECSSSCAGIQKASLPSWLCSVETANYGKFDLSKAKDDETILNDKVANLQKKWNDICQRLHHGGSVLRSDANRAVSEKFPRSVGFPVVDTGSLSQTSKSPKTDQGRNTCENTFPIGIGVQKAPLTKQSMSISVPSGPSKENLISELQLRVSHSDQPKTDGFQSSSGSRSDLGVHDDHTSPSSVASVSTDLTLGTVHAYPPEETKHPLQANYQSPTDLRRCLPAHKAESVSGNVSVVTTQSSVCHSYSDSPLLSSSLPLQRLAASQAIYAGVSGFNNRDLGQFDYGDFKTLYRSLIQKVGRQEEAIGDIVETITRCRTGNGRRHGIWLSFLGPDRMGMKRIAIALTELLFGSRGKLIHVNLCLHDGTLSSNKICDELGVSGCEENFRGKMVVDHIADKIRNNPWSVVFLENVDKADLLVQSSLSQAIATGRFSDSHRREVSISNTVFVTTAREIKNNTSSLKEGCTNFTEQRVLASQKWQMKILVESAYRPLSVGPISNLDVFSPSKQESSNRPCSSPCSVYVNKRKLDSANEGNEQCKSSETTKRAHTAFSGVLDLNMPFEETAASDTENSSDESSSVASESSSAWLEEFFGLVDKTILFKPFDFDALADNVLKEINKCFRNSIGSKCLLEIDPKAMEQILAATWLLEDAATLTSWLEQVLARSFIEAHQRYNISSQTVLRLVACEDLFMNEEAPGIHLPSRILMN